MAEHEEVLENETDVDRRLEAIMTKFLSGNASSEDEEKYERLMAWRRSNLVKLPAVKPRARWHHKRAG